MPLHIPYTFIPLYQHFRSHYWDSIKNWSPPQNSSMPPSPTHTQRWEQRKPISFLFNQVRNSIRFSSQAVFNISDIISIVQVNHCQKKSNLAFRKKEMTANLDIQPVIGR